MPDLQHNIQYLHDLLQLLPQASPVARAAMLRLASEHLRLLAGQEEKLSSALPPAPGSSNSNHSGNRGGRHALQ